MRIKPLQYLFAFAVLASVQAQDSIATTISPNDNPLVAYLSDMDEMGRTLSGWKSKDIDHGSWFFGSYAMVLLRNNENKDNEPYPGLVSRVPALWSDFKYLTPRYLIELAGGALSSGGLMSIKEDLDYRSLRTEEKFIHQVAGFAYLRMLQGSIGDSLFHVIVSESIQKSTRPSLITTNLITTMKKHCCEELGVEFEKALSSSRWADTHLDRVRARGDSLEITIQHKGPWHFPVDVLVITKSSDSTRYTYPLSQSTPLLVPEGNVEKVIVDPDHVLAEYYRYNNSWPRLKDNFHIQPFGALPDWQSYRITVNPSSWSDWDDDKRYSLKFTTGFGIDLWPAYPSDYRHRTVLELNAHTSLNDSEHWGGRFNYSHPLNLNKRLFSQVNVHSYDDWQGLSIGLTKYIGKQTYLIQGPRLTYQRINLEMEYDNYGDSLVWAKKQKISIIKSAYSALSLTRQGDRIYVVLRSAIGQGPHDSFYIAKSSVDLTGVFWGWLIGGFQFVGGSQSTTTPAPYEFTHDYAWQDGLSAIPNFRGQTKLTENTNEYLGIGLSGGYWLSGIQLKAFSSALIVDMETTGWDKVIPRYTAGFGFEHKSFFTAGIYFPIWQSHPIEGEESWMWRYQWRLVWNL